MREAINLYHKATCGHPCTCCHICDDSSADTSTSHGSTAVDDWHGCADFAYNIRAVTEMRILLPTGSAAKSVALVTSIWWCHAPFVRRERRINRPPGVWPRHWGAIVVKWRSIVVRYVRSVHISWAASHAILGRPWCSCFQLLHLPPQLEVLQQPT